MKSSRPPKSDSLTLIPSGSAELGAELDHREARARTYAAASRAKNTQRTYKSQWCAFAAWCGDRGLTALPAEGATVAMYLAELADDGRATAGIAVVLTAISQAHLLAGETSPRTAPAAIEVWKGIRRTLGTASKGKAPLRIDALEAAVAALPPTLAGVRDRALLLLGFGGAFRRSELVGLAVEDLAERAEGLEVTLRRSKTDQAGAGRVVPIPFSDEASCPVRAVRAWLEASRITTGPLFRAVNRWGRVSSKHLGSAHVARVVKSCAEAAGISADELAGHSLRAGFCTSAAESGATEREIMWTTGHRSVETVLRYIRPARRFEGLATVRRRGPRAGDR